MLRVTSIGARSSWTRRLSLVWQPIWIPAVACPPSGISEGHPPSGTFPFRGRTAEGRPGGDSFSSGTNGRESTAVCGEILTRVRPFYTGWKLGPLEWWRLAATLGPSYVAYLDRWVWQTVQAQGDSDAVWHINLWPQTVQVAAPWIAGQPITGLALEVTEQLPWPPTLWSTLREAWIDRGGAVWLDDWSDPDQVPGLSGLAGVKLDLHIWDGMTPTGADRWAAFVDRCHERGLSVIAEGVETAAQRDEALAWGCDGLQGFLWGRPQPWPRQEEGRR